MTRKEKIDIQSRLRDYCEQKGSQNKAARTLKDISAGTVSQILNGNWDLISDDMWRNVAAQIGYDRRPWHIVGTRGYRRMTGVLRDAQDNALVLAVTGDAGSGKTEAIRQYAARNRNVYHLCCSEYWSRKQFLTELLRAIGMEAAGTVPDMMYDAVQALKKRDAPLIILDEADKLTDQVLYFFISLYNSLEDHCGIMLSATDYLEKRLRRGVKASRKGYREIWSRLGRKFIEVPLPGEQDITAICMANGVENKTDLRRIVEESDCDLRRVKRLVCSLCLDREEEAA